MTVKKRLNRIVMDISEALRAAGVRDDTLTSEEKGRLSRDGFLPLPGILAPDQIAAMRAWVDDRLAREGDAGGSELGYPLDPGDGTLADLINKDPMFDVCFTHPRVLAGIACVLESDLKLSSLNFRAPLPGHGLQSLHADWEDPVADREYQVCNSIWLLDEFTEENGSTRVVPGTHRSGRLPHEAMEDAAAPHPDEIRLLAPAGTVVIFNGHLWHGGTLNAGTDRRRACHAYFCRRHQPQQIDQRRLLRPETASRLSEAARTILDV